MAPSFSFAKLATLLLAQGSAALVTKSFGPDGGGHAQSAHGGPPSNITEHRLASGSWKSLGCYTDSVSARTLTSSEAVTGGTNAMTNELCQTACLNAGFSIAGTEYAGECCK